MVQVLGRYMIIEYLDPQGLGFGFRGYPETNLQTQKGPIQTTVTLKGVRMGFHVSLGECRGLGI